MNSTFEAITTPSIALSGFLGTIIFAIISANAKIKRNPLRFFVSLEESLFMTSSMRLFRFVYIGFLIVFFSTSYSIFIVSTISGIDSDLLEFLLKLIFPNPIVLLLVILSIFLVMQVLCLKSIQKKITNFIYDKKRKKKLRQASILFFLIFGFVYLIFYSLIYGWFVNELLREQANLMKIPYDSLLDILLSINLFNRFTIITLVVVTIVYALLLLRVKNLFRYLGHSKIAINIILKNGAIFSNKQLIHTDIENSYLISDSLNFLDPTKHLIPKNNIEFVSFTNTYCSLGKDVNESHKIIVVEDFTRDELALLKAIKKQDEVKNKIYE